MIVHDLVCDTPYPMVSVVGRRRFGHGFNFERKGRDTSALTSLRSAGAPS